MKLPFTLAAFHKAAVSATLLPLAPLADESLTVAGNDLTIPSLNALVAALVFGDAPTQAQLRSPSLRRLILEDISKMINTETCVGAQNVIVDRSADPLILEASEKLNVYTIHTLDGWALVWLADGPITPVHGDIHTIRATTGHTTAENIWENVALTFDQTLPVGRYQVVGMRAFGTNLLAARLVFIGYGWRPGVPAGDVISAQDVKLFRKGKFGAFGEFEFDAPPTVDLVGSGVTAAEEIYLDLIQTRAGR